MEQETIKLKAKLSGVLVKWDAALLDGAPPADIDPTTHPACIEVLRLEDDRDPQVIYRRT
jgi:hypothetical protein